MNPVSELRPSPIAGLWYDDNPVQLANQIDAYLDQAVLPELKGEVLAVIAPHAGHRYSGRTAGYAFRPVVGKQVDLVIIVSPMHQNTPVPIITSAHKGYETPFNPVWIERDAVHEIAAILKRNANLDLVQVSNDREHSLEIELPFLQRALRPGFKLLPLMLHTRSAQVANDVGKALADIARSRSVLLVASSDLSHFYSLPDADRFDNEMLHQIANFSPLGVLEAEQSGRGFACGAAAIAAVLWAAQEMGGNRVEILHHSTSAEQTGDEQSVVGYGAAVILKQTL